MTDSINALVATNDQSLWMEWGGREEDSEQIAPSLASLRPGAKILHYANAAKEERRILLVVVYYGNDTPPPVLRFETGLFNRCSVDEAQKLSSPLALALSLPTYWTQTALAGDRDALVKLALATRDHAKQWGGAFRLSRWAIGYLLAHLETIYKEVGEEAFAGTTYTEMGAFVSGVEYPTWQAWKRAAKTFLIEGNVPGLELYTLADIMDVPIDVAIRALGPINDGIMTERKTELLMSGSVTAEEMQTLARLDDDQLDHLYEQEIPSPRANGETYTYRAYDPERGLFGLVTDGVFTRVLKVLSDEPAAQQWVSDIVERTRTKVRPSPAKVAPHVVIEQQDLEL